MIQYSYPVRNNTPQRLVYTFLDQNQQPIDLTNYSTVSVVIKLQGQASQSVSATFNNVTAGIVSCPFWIPIANGVYDAQFVCLDGSSNKLYGEPVQFTVVKNVDDLGTPELANY